MNKYKEFVELFVKKQLNYLDFNHKDYTKYIEEQKEFYDKNVTIKNIFPTFESWFNVWGLTEEEYEFVINIVEEME